MCFSHRKRLKRSVGALGCVSIGAVDGLSREVRETFLAFTNSLFSDREFMSFLGFLVFSIREFVNLLFLSPTRFVKPRVLFG